MSSKSRKLRFLSLMWDYAAAISLISVLILLWHLGKGPVEVNFLRPYIIQALTNETSSYDLSVGSVNLELVHSVQPVSVIAKDVVLEAKDGRFAVKAPRLSMSFSARALLKGMLAPSSVALEEPEISVTNVYGLKKEDEGSVEALSDAKNEGNVPVVKQGFQGVHLKKLEFYFSQFEEFMERFNAPERLYMESFINNIDVTGGRLKVMEAETGQEFLFDDLGFSFERGVSEILITTDSAVKFENRTSGLDMALKYRLVNDEVNFELNFSDLVVTDLIDAFSRERSDLRAVDIPVNGRVSAVIDFGNVLKNKEHFADTLGDNIKDVSFEIEGGAGKIGFGDDDDFDYDVSSFTLLGRLHGQLDKVNIENAAFDFQGKKAVLGLSAEGFKNYLLKGDLADFKVHFTAKTGGFKVNELSKLWPKYWGNKAWEWCKEGLYGGEISNAAFDFEFGWDKKSKKFGLLSLNGTAEVKDANLFYLKGMPVVKNVYGLVKFSKDKIEILVDKGVSDGVILTGGTVLLYDLDKEDNFIKLDLVGNSTIADALKLIDHEPLGFAKGMGVKPDEVLGDVDIALKLDFELKSDLAPEEIKVQVEGDLKQVEYLGLKDGETLKADNLRLLVTDKGFDLKGAAVYQGIGVNLTVSEDFKEKKHKSRVTAEVKVNDKVLKALDIDAEILAAPYFTGESEVKATLTFLNNGDIEIFADGDLKNTAMDYAFLGFAKPKGVPCRAKAKILVDKEKLKEVSEFSLMKAQFSAKGKMEADSKGRLKTIDIAEIKAPRAFAKAKVAFVYEPKLKLRVTVSGDSYDLTEFFDNRKQSGAKDKTKKQKSLKDPLEDVTDTDIVVGVNKLWTNPKVPVTNFAGKAELRHGIGLYRLNLVGNYGSSKDVKMKLDFEPRGNEFILNVDSNNAGSTLKVLRLYEHMKGGNLTIEAKRDKYKNFRGHAKMRDFMLSDTPIVAKVLSLSSLTGIVDMLTGEGLRFTHLNAPFSYTFSTKKLATEDAKLFGPVMGMTVSGSYDLFDDTLNAKGMVIPAYGLNTMIGSIPLVGRVLAGKDGSVFGMNYRISGSIDKPEVEINPLSTLAPNSIKELFSE
ncbi:MAG: AsmA-like C-terminal domain-containing protein [Alphaproteobacteria bacterium]|nr:AsmA-like C-terminal domain-containing protein [Alphaproteobacteria bacterium]